MSNTAETDNFIEKSYDKNIRHICYSLLSKVTFEDEPVVPKILSEKRSDLIGDFFEVENLEGVDFIDYVLDKTKPKELKLKILLHIVKQLKAIDDAGFVIFDRHGRNIRLLSESSDHIATRQIDIEDMYDKKADCVYSLMNASMSDDLIDIFKEKDIPLWVQSVDKLAIIGEAIGETHNSQTIVDIFSLCRWERGERGHDLNELERACLQAINNGW